MRLRISGKLRPDCSLENAGKSAKYRANFPKEMTGRNFFLHVGNYLKARGMQKVKLVGYDLIERNTQLLSDGVITALVAQRPERQGYDGIKSLCNHLLFKQNPEKVNLMPIDILLKENLKYYLNNKL